MIKGRRCKLPYPLANGMEVWMCGSMEDAG